MGEGTNKELSSKQKIAIIVATIVLFIGASAGMAYIFSKIGADPSVSVGSGIVSGAFVVWVVLSVTGILKEFSIKTPLVEMTSKLEEKIADVKKETEKVQNNLQSINQRIDNVMMSVSNSNAKAEVKNIEHYHESRGEFNATFKESGIPQNRINPDKIIPPEYLEKLDELAIKVDTFEKLLDNKVVPNIEELMQRANIFFYKRKYKKAIDLYDQILSLDKNNVAALFNKAYSLDALCDHNEALSCYQMALKLDPNNSSILHNIGGVYSSIGDDKKAIEYYENALKIAPDDIVALNNISLVLLHVGETKKALSYLEQAIKIRPDYFKTLSNLAMTYHKLNDQINLKKTYEQILQLTPKNNEELLSIGIAHISTRNLEKAIEIFDQILKANPDDDTALYNKACAKALMGDNTESLDLLKQSIRIDKKWKFSAVVDDDFVNIRNSTEFKKLVK